MKNKIKSRYCQTEDMRPTKQILEDKLQGLYIAFQATNDIPTLREASRIYNRLNYVYAKLNNGRQYLPRRQKHYPIKVIQ
jgi:hypothetical protein